MEVPSAAGFAGQSWRITNRRAGKARNACPPQQRMAGTVLRTFARPAPYYAGPLDAAAINFIATPFMQ